MTREEILRLRPHFAELIANPPPMPPKRKPKPDPELRMPLNGKIAEAAKANPASVEVRVSADAADGTTVIHRRRPTEIIQPLEVDAEGRVSLARRIDCETGEQSVVEMVGGYRPQTGAVSDYSPIARFEEGFEK